MTARPDIAELLHAGVSHLDIARQLHVSRKTVAKAHHLLGLPARVRGGGTPYACLEDAFLAHAEPVDGGHVRWTGCIDGGVPRVFYRGQRMAALRVAFRLHHGRDAEGRLTRTCRMPGCVAGAHHADQHLRAANRRADKAYTAIFGVAS